MFYLDDLIESEIYQNADPVRRQEMAKAYYQTYVVPDEGESPKGWRRFQKHVFELEDVRLQKSDVMYNLTKVGPSLTTTSMLMTGEAPTPAEPDNLAVDMARQVAPMLENIGIGATVGLPASAVGGPGVGAAVGFAAPGMINEAVRQNIETGEVNWLDVGKRGLIEGAIGALTFGSGRFASRAAARAVGVTSKAVPVAEKAAEALTMSGLSMVASGDEWTMDNFIKSAVPAATFIGMTSVMRISKWGAPKMKEISQKYGVHPEDVNEQFNRMAPEDKAELLRDPNKLEQKMNEIARGVKMAQEVMDAQKGKAPMLGVGEVPEGAFRAMASEYVSPPVEPFESNSVYSLKNVRNNALEKFQIIFNTTPLEANTVAAMLDARGLHSGRTLEEFYNSKIADVVLGGDPMNDMLFKLSGKTQKKLYDFLEARDESQYYEQAKTFIAGLAAKSSGKSILHGNEKTLLSIDISGICRMAEMGWNCLHCYAGEEVNQLISSWSIYEKDRGRGDLFSSYQVSQENRLQGMSKDTNAWTDITSVSEAINELRAKDYPAPITNPPSYKGGKYNPKDIEGMPKQVVEFFNEVLGGLRMYAFGDFKQADVALADRVIADAGKKNLKIKIITGCKEPIERWGHLDHVSFNLSSEFAPKFAELHKSIILQRLREAAHLQKKARSTKIEKDEYWEFDVPKGPLVRDDVMREPGIMKQPTWWNRGPMTTEEIKGKEWERPYDPYEKPYGGWDGTWNGLLASKIIDETDIPMVVYHGTPMEFNRFDLESSGGMAFFSELPRTAQGYGDVMHRTLKDAGKKVLNLTAHDTSQLKSRHPKAYKELLNFFYEEVAPTFHRNVLNKYMVFDKGGNVVDFRRPANDPKLLTRQQINEARITYGKHGDLDIYWSMFVDRLQDGELWHKYGGSIQRDLLRRMKNIGYKHVIFRDLANAEGVPERVHVILDPELIMTPEQAYTSGQVFVYLKSDKTKYQLGKHEFKKGKPDVEVSTEKSEGAYRLLVNREDLTPAFGSKGKEFTIPAHKAGKGLDASAAFRGSVEFRKKIPISVPREEADVASALQYVMNTIKSGMLHEYNGKWTIEDAAKLRQPGKVMTRYTSMNRREYIHAVWDPELDVVTPYHGPQDSLQIAWSWMSNANFRERMNILFPGAETSLKAQHNLIAMASVFEKPYTPTKEGKVPYKMRGAGGKGEFTPEEIARELGPDVNFREWLETANRKSCCLGGKCVQCSVTCGQGAKATAQMAKSLGRYVDGEYLGAVRFLDDGRAIVHAFKNPSYRTLVHELGHIFRRDLSGPLLDRVERYYGVKNGKWERSHEEAFGIDWERWAMDGTYPSKGMVPMFKMFKDWVVSIYKKLVGQGVDLGEEPSKFFEEMLGIEPGKKREFFEMAQGYSVEPTLAGTRGPQSAVEAKLSMVMGRFVPLYDNDPNVAKHGNNVLPIKQHKTLVKEGPFAGQHAGVFVTEAMGNALRKQSRDYRQTLTENWLMNPLYVLEKIPVMRNFYYRLRTDEAVAHRVSREIKDHADKIVFKGIPTKDLENIGAFMASIQQGGPEKLAATGVKEIRKLSARDLDAVNYIREVLDAKIQQLNHVRIACGKQPIPKVENYFTFMTRFNELVDLNLNPVFVSTDFFKHQLKPTGMMEHSRTGAIAPIELNAQKVFHKYITDVERIIQLSPTIAQARLLTERKLPIGSNGWRLKEANPQAYKFISEWLDHVAGKGKTGTWGHLPNFLERAMHRLNKNTRTGVMSFYFPSALKQPLAYVNTIADVGVKSALTGAIENLSPSRRKFAMNMSEVLRNREVDVSLAEAYESARTPIGGTINVMSKYGFAPLRFLDMETARSTWLAAYDRAAKLGMVGKEKARYADDMVVKGQGSASRLDVSPAQRTELGRFITLFQTFAIADWNHLRREVLGIKNDIPKAEVMRRTMRLMLATELANMAWLAATGRSAIPTPLSAAIEASQQGELDEKDIPKILGSVAQRIPIVGSVEYGNVAPGAQYLVQVASETYKRGAPDPFDVLTLAGIPASQQIKRIYKWDKEKREANDKLYRQMYK